MSYFTNNQEYPFGIDISRYNTSADGKKKVDFNVIAGHNPKVLFAGLRAGISWGYQDPWYSYYMQEFLRINVLRMPYHVLYPGESAQAQMDNFSRILGVEDLTHVRLVLDLELSHGYPKSRITECLNQSLSILKARTGRYPIIYSRAGWVNEFLIFSALPKLDWWLAQYRTPRLYPLYTPEYPCPPSLPIGCNTWLIHQTAEKAPSIGAAGNHYMDYNRWNGSESDVLKYFDVDVVVPPVMTLEEQVADNTRRIEILEAK